MDQIVGTLKRWNDFEGRSSRQEFWLFYIFAVLIGMAARWILGGAIGGLVTLVLIVPTVAVTVRRFHDQDKSGWMALLWIVPFIGWIAVLVFMAMEGTAGPNRYGSRED